MLPLAETFNDDGTAPSAKLASSQPKPSAYFYARVFGQAWEVAVINVDGYQSTAPVYVEMATEVLYFGTAISEYKFILYKPRTPISVKSLEVPLQQ